MNLFSRIGAVWRKSAGDPYGGLGAFIELFGRRTAKSDVVVNADTALKVATVFACLRVIAEGIAQSPCDLFQDRADGKGKDLAKNHPLYLLFSLAPNTFQTPFEFFETLVFHVGLTGGFIAFKNIVDGQIRELIPIERSRWKVAQRPDDLSLVYKIRGLQGGEQDFPEEVIWHVRGPSWNGFDGIDLLRVAREAIGLSVAIEEDQSRLYANGMRTSGTYSVEGNLTEAQYGQLRKFIKEHQAADDGGPLILDRAAKYVSDTLKGVDAQTLESRKHQVEEICRWARVMPIMIGHAGNQSPTFASAEQFFIAHVTHTLLPWCRRIETSINKNLIGSKAFVGGLKAKFNLTSLMRGSFADRQTSFAKMLGAGGSPAYAEVNEVRELDDMNPVAWGNGKPEPATTKAPAPEPAA